MKIKLTITLFSFVMSSLAVAQDKQNLASGLAGTVELQSSFSSGNTPLWLNANRYGLSSLKSNNGYMRFIVERSLDNDSTRKWGLGYGVDVAAAYGFTSTVIPQQYYVKGRWRPLSLTIGQKEEALNLKPDELTTGSQTLGINARPMPGVRLALDDYWNIPGTKQWLGLKGHFAYYMATDGGWQQDWAEGHGTYNKKTLYNTKSAFLRFGATRHPLTVEAGLEMATQFGGTTYNPNGSVLYKNDNSAKAFFKAIYGGSNQQEGLNHYYSSEGNVLGSVMLRINYDKPTYYIGVYADHFFEDCSQMVFLDYDGYGTGTEWEVKKDNRYLRYPLKDMMAGIEVKLKTFRLVNHLVFEYVGTKNQSGPIFHDHTQNISDHIGGKDDYMNHNGIYNSWSHWGQIMGNPLYRAPLYNENGSLKTENNRFIAWHLGIGGDPTEHLHYRVLSTWQKGWGTYDNPFNAKERNYSFLAEAGYSFGGNLKGLLIKGAFALDHGEILGNNIGGQITIRWTRLFCK